MTKRGKIRLCSFVIALISVLSIMDIKYYIEKNDALEKLNYAYARSTEELAGSVDNIQSELNKGLYCADDEMLSRLAQNVKIHAQTAKASLSQLPITELSLENTYKYLSQVGAYAVSLSEKIARNESISEDEYNNIKTLYDYGKQLSEDMWMLEKEIEMGLVDFSNTQSKNSDYIKVESGFEEFEDGFSDYPTLIYDGPFSDHILTREPQMIKGKAVISKEEAENKAKAISKKENLVDNGNEDGKMSSYTFTDGNTTIAITANGGYPSYMICDRNVNESNISAEEAVRIATEFVNTLGYSEVKTTYYEIMYNTVTINFAGVQDGATLYTDLIKVSVALDNGEILGFDARGYITNHTQRDLSGAVVTQEEAKAKLSPKLNIKRVSDAVIYTDEEKDAYCYEFYCTSNEGDNILIYINKQTGRVEDILKLLITESGVLAE